MEVVATMSRILILVCILLSSPSLSFSQETIRTYNSSNYLGNDRWGWTIYIRASNETLDKIRAVTYTLHDSFQLNKIPVTNIGNANTPFALNSSGWGTFTIKVEISYKDGRPIKILTHPLTFGEENEANYDIIIRNSNEEISENWWRWTVYVASSEVVLNQIKCVEYTLHESFSNPIQLICEKTSNQKAFPFSARGWGTFEIKVKVIYKDGKIQNLRHMLEFGN